MKLRSRFISLAHKACCGRRFARSLPLKEWHHEELWRHTVSKAIITCRWKYNTVRIVGIYLTCQSIGYIRNVDKQIIRVYWPTNGKTAFGSRIQNQCIKISPLHTTLLGQTRSWSKMLQNTIDAFEMPLNYCKNPLLRLLRDFYTGKAFQNVKSYKGGEQSPRSPTLTHLNVQKRCIPLRPN